MSHHPPDEFYVGYADRAPAGIARFVRRGIAVLGVIGAGAALLVAASQQGAEAAAFEFGQTREFQGLVATSPYPALLVERPGGSVSRYHLVAPGKHGADDLVHDLDGRPAQLAGSLIYRDDQTMIEVARESITSGTREGGSVGTRREPEVLGTVTLQGEIVDSKCFLGAMNPAAWTPHRACAVRCVSGGVPPMLVVRDSAGVVTYILLADAQGRPSGKALLDLIAEPVEVTGRLERHDGQLFMFADRPSYRRIS